MSPSLAILLSIFPSSKYLHRPAATFLLKSLQIFYQNMAFLLNKPKICEGGGRDSFGLSFLSTLRLWLVGILRFGGIFLLFI